MGSSLEPQQFTGFGQHSRQIFWASLLLAWEIPLAHGLALLLFDGPPA
jgi:hypothetical protein